MNAGDKEKYLRQAASLKNGTARQMEIAQSLQVLVAEVERLRAENERLLNDATDRIGYADYLRSDTKTRVLTYREWLAAGEPETVPQAVSA